MQDLKPAGSASLAAAAHLLAAASLRQVSSKRLNTEIHLFHPEPLPVSTPAAAVTLRGSAGAAAHQPAGAQPASHGQPDLRFMDGLRGIFSVLVVIFHCYMVWFSLVPYSVSSTLQRHHWFVRLVSAAGPLSVDVFLVLTAALATLQLVSALERSPSPWRAVYLYWRRRAARILPAYSATVGLLAAVGWLYPSASLSSDGAAARDFNFSTCPRDAWHNLLFIQNINARVGESCGGYLWSIALQVQFYAAFPLLLLALRPRGPGFRTRLAAVLAAAAVGGVALRAWLVRSAGPALRLPVGDYGRDPGEASALAALMSSTYYTLEHRATELAMGAALGLALATPSSLAWLRARLGFVSAAAILCQAAYSHLVVEWAPWGALQREQPWPLPTARLYAALLHWGSPFAGALVCTTLAALALRSDPLHACAADALSAPALKPLAALSFCVYLLHDLARMLAVVHLLPTNFLSSLSAAAPVAGLAAQAAITLAGAFALAACMHRWVERQFG